MKTDTLHKGKLAKTASHEEEILDFIYFIIEILTIL